jgi:hypothetical protein
MKEPVMGSVSPALQSSSAPHPDSGETEPPPPSAGVTRRSERRIPTARETFATLPEIEDEFEAHDTIPAPPWLDDELPASGGAS